MDLLISSLAFIGSVTLVFLACKFCAWVYETDQWIGGKDKKENCSSCKCGKKG